MITIPNISKWKKFRNIISILLWIIAASNVGGNASAASVKQFYFDPGESLLHAFSEKDSTTTYADLNGDGKKENIKVTRNKNTCRVYVNGKYQFKYPYREDYSRYVSGDNLVFLHNSSVRRSNVSAPTRTDLVDLNRKDKYLEILVANVKGLTLYRYTGKKLKKYAAVSVPLYFTSVGEKGAFEYFSGHHIRGDGKIEVRSTIHSSKNKIELWLVYKIRNGTLVLDTGTDHNSVYDPGKLRSLNLEDRESFYTLSKNSKLKAVTSLYVYNRSDYHSKKLQKLFTINVGEKYEILKVRIGKPYTAMNVKSNGKKGWIFVNSDKLML